MNNPLFNVAETLRAQIAALAARMIAEDGADFGAAKRRAAKQLLGNHKIRGDMLPDNSEIEASVREYNAIFFADSQPQRLLHLRKLALKIMLDLEHFGPYLIGAVLNGTAGEHSDIYLQLFTDNGKEVVMYLLNKNIQFDVSESTSKRNEPVEALSFLVGQDGVHLSLYDQDDIKTAPRIERADIEAVRALIATDSPEESEYFV